MTYKGKYIESPEYIVKNNNVYYVSDSSGSDDNDGKGTILSPWKTIGHAISSAVATAQVPAYIRVQEGTYSENITMERYVYLYGGYDTNWFRDIENNETIIQGTGSTHVVEGDNDSILDGFTITGGDTAYGGGIYISNESPTISNCIIENNEAQYGGGIYISNSSARINNCQITDNLGQVYTTSPRGGGIFISGSDNVIIKNSTISNNIITMGGSSSMYGGGLYIQTSQVNIENCLFEANAGISIGVVYVRGGGICIIEDNGCIRKNSIFKSNYIETNGSVNYGGGIYIYNNERLKILGSIFYKNEAGVGGGIFVDGYADITNCTFMQNEASYGVGVYFLLNQYTTSMTNCIVWEDGDDIFGSSTISYCCIQDNDTGTGNLYLGNMGLLQKYRENF